MPKARIKNGTAKAFYFVTPTVWNWYYVFDRHNRWDILADSLRYCQNKKSLKIYAYVFMLNHIHMIISADDVASVLRDFKRYTSGEVKRNIAQTERNVVDLFTEADGTWRLWKDDNQPKLIESQSFFLQKMKYIHNNPVQKGYVERPEYWKWSSANPNSPIAITPIAQISPV